MLFRLRVPHWYFCNLRWKFFCLAIYQTFYLTFLWLDLQKNFPLVWVFFFFQQVVVKVGLINFSADPMMFFLRTLSWLRETFWFLIGSNQTKGQNKIKNYRHLMIVVRDWRKFQTSFSSSTSWIKTHILLYLEGVFHFIFIFHICDQKRSFLLAIFCGTGQGLCK